MSGVEKLEAAIAKLETLRDDCSQGEWVGWRQYDPLRGLRLGIEIDGDDLANIQTGNVADAELVELLHRTVTPQIVILKATLESFTGRAPYADYRPGLALAEAILAVPA